ncbi:Splicing factor, arginine/serine-rich, partial [Globisporangium splendens]
MARVFVGNLPTDTRELDLEKKFDKFGRIRSIQIKFPQRPPAFAFIEYEDERDADDAHFGGNRLRVEISRARGEGNGGSFGDRQRGTQFRVLVSNLPTSVSWQDLKDFLRGGGDVAHVDVDRRGNGVASFATFDDMERTILKLDDKELQGEHIRIREERGGDGGGSRNSDGGRDRDRGGGSRGRSRSYSPPLYRGRSRSPPSNRGGRRGRSYSRSPSPAYRRRYSSRSRSR